jgi:putative aldouronate transport system permease protein
LQHRLYVYLTTASNLEQIIQSSPASAVQHALNSKVLKYTISMVTIIPILAVYPFMQKYFQKGIMLGAVKG